MVRVVGDLDPKKLPETKNMDTLATALMDSSGPAGNGHALLYIMHQKGKLLPFDHDPMLIITKIHDKWSSKAKVSVGDRILCVNAKPCSSVAELGAILQGANDGLLPVSFRFSNVPGPSTAMLNKLGKEFDQEKKGYEVTNRFLEFHSKTLQLNLIIRNCKGKVLVLRTVEGTLAWHLFQAGDRILAVDDELCKDGISAKDTLLQMLAKKQCVNVLVMRPQSTEALQTTDAMLNKLHTETEASSKDKGTKPSKTASVTSSSAPVSASPALSVVSTKPVIVPLTPPKINPKSSVPISLPPASTTSALLMHPLNGDVAELVKKELDRRRKNKAAVAPKSQLRVATHQNAPMDLNGPTTSTVGSAPVSGPALKVTDSVYGKVQPAAGITPLETKTEMPSWDPKAVHAAHAKKKDLIKISEKPNSVDIGRDTPSNVKLRSAAKH